MLGLHTSLALNYPLPPRTFLYHCYNNSLSWLQGGCGCFCALHGLPLKEFLGSKKGRSVAFHFHGLSLADFRHKLIQRFPRPKCHICSIAKAHKAWGFGFQPVKRQLLEIQLDDNTPLNALNVWKLVSERMTNPPRSTHLLKCSSACSSCCTIPVACKQSKTSHVDVKRPCLAIKQGWRQETIVDACHGNAKCLEYEATWSGFLITQQQQRPTQESGQWILLSSESIQSLWPSSLRNIMSAYTGVICEQVWLLKTFTIWNLKWNASP